MYNTFKNLTIKTLGYSFTAKLKKMLGKGGFSEIDAIYEFLLNQSIPKIMLDVGVHFGESSIFFLQKKWKVIGFEPDPANRKEIPQHKNLIVNTYALSDHSDQNVDFFTSTESSGISSLLNFSPTHQSKYKVDIKTLDTVMSEFALNEIGFLKIDTEGYDLYVLRGLTFENVMPKIVLCEFEDNKTLNLGYTYKDMGNFLLEKGYKVYLSEWLPITKYGSTHKWKSFRKYPTTVEENAWGNFLAVAPEYHQEFENFMDSYREPFV